MVARIDSTLPSFIIDGTGACVDHAEVFAKAGDLFDRKSMREAVRVCLRCPFRRPCRVHAITAREPWGVWGGMSAEQRELFIRNSARRARDLKRGSQR